MVDVTEPTPDQLKALTDKGFLDRDGFIGVRDIVLEAIRGNDDAKLRDAIGLYRHTVEERSELCRAEGDVPDSFFIESDNGSFSSAARLDAISAVSGGNTWSSSSSPSKSRKKRAILLEGSFFGDHIGNPYRKVDKKCAVINEIKRRGFDIYYATHDSSCFKKLDIDISEEFVKQNIASIPAGESDYSTYYHKILQKNFGLNLKDMVRLSENSFYSLKEIVVPKIIFSEGYYFLNAIIESHELSNFMRDSGVNELRVINYLKRTNKTDSCIAEIEKVLGLISKGNDVDIFTELPKIHDDLLQSPYFMKALSIYALGYNNHCVAKRIHEAINSGDLGDPYSSFKSTLVASVAGKALSKKPDSKSMDFVGNMQGLLFGEENKELWLPYLKSLKFDTPSSLLPVMDLLLGKEEGYVKGEISRIKEHFVLDPSFDLSKEPLLSMLTSLMNDVDCFKDLDFIRGLVGGDNRLILGILTCSSLKQYSNAVKILEEDDDLKGKFIEYAEGRLPTAQAHEKRFLQALMVKFIDKGDELRAVVDEMSQYEFQSLVLGSKIDDDIISKDLFPYYLKMRVDKQCFDGADLRITKRFLRSDKDRKLKVSAVKAILESSSVNILTLLDEDFFQDHEEIFIEAVGELGGVIRNPTDIALFYSKLITKSFGKESVQRLREKLFSNTTFVNSFKVLCRKDLMADCVYRDLNVADLGYELNVLDEFTLDFKCFSYLYSSPQTAEKATETFSAICKQHPDKIALDGAINSIVESFSSWPFKDRILFINALRPVFLLRYVDTAIAEEKFNESIVKLILKGVDYPTFKSEDLYALRAALGVVGSKVSDSSKSSAIKYPCINHWGENFNFEVIEELLSKEINVEIKIIDAIRGCSPGDAHKVEDLLANGNVKFTGDGGLYSKEMIGKIFSGTGPEIDHKISVAKKFGFDVSRVNLSQLLQSIRNGKVYYELGRGNPRYDEVFGCLDRAGYKFDQVDAMTSIEYMAGSYFVKSQINERVGVKKLKPTPYEVGNFFEYIKNEKDGRYTDLDKVINVLYKFCDKDDLVNVVTKEDERVKFLRFYDQHLITGYHGPAYDPESKFTAEELGFDYKTLAKELAGMSRLREQYDEFNRKKGLFIAKGAVGDVDMDEESDDEEKFEMQQVGAPLNGEFNRRLRFKIVEFDENYNRHNVIAQEFTEITEAVYNVGTTTDEFSSKRFEEDGEFFLLRGNSIKQGDGSCKLSSYSIHCQNKIAKAVVGDNSGARITKVAKDEFGFFHIETDKPCQIEYVLQIPPKRERETVIAGPVLQDLIKQYEENRRKHVKTPKREDYPEGIAGKEEWLEGLFKSGQGSCRNRVKAFVYMARKSGIEPDSYRAVGIDNNHVAIEIVDKETNIAKYYDLGGVSAEKEYSDDESWQDIAPAKSGADLADKKAEEKKMKKEIESLQKKIREMRSDAAGLPTTPGSSPSPPKTPPTPEQIAAKKRDEDFRKALDKNTDYEKVGNKESLLSLVSGANPSLAIFKDLDAATRLIVAHAKSIDSSRDIICINKVQDVDILKQVLSLEEDGNAAIKTSGFLSSAIDGAKTDPLLVINWDAFSSSQKVAFNSVIDSERTIQGKELNKFKVVGISSKKSKDESFLSRNTGGIFEIDEDFCSSYLRAEADKIPPGETADIAINIEGYDNWRQKLFGAVVMTRGFPEWRKSGFVTSLEKDRAALPDPTPGEAGRTLAITSTLAFGSTNFTIHNIAKEAKAELLREIELAKELGYLSYQGYKIEVPKNLKISFAAKEFDFTEFKDDGIEVFTDSLFSQVPPTAKVISSQTFDYLLYDKKVEHGTYSQTAGFLEKNKGKGVEIFITSTLTETQFYCLFNEAKKHNVTLKLSLAPNVETPSSMLTEIEAEIAKRTPTMMEDKKQSSISVTNDANEYLAKYAPDTGALIIDIEDHDYQSLVRRISFEIDQDMGFTDFKDIESQLIAELQTGKIIQQRCKHCKLQIVNVKFIDKKHFS
tara:strand:- start:570 stop:6512 length:5943 start_codon:yes stop_codon:yes gene_type:complete